MLCHFDRLPNELKDVIFQQLDTPQLTAFIYHRQTHSSAVSFLWRRVTLQPSRDADSLDELDRFLRMVQNFVTTVIQGLPLASGIEELTMSILVPQAIHLCNTDPIKLLPLDWDLNTISSMLDNLSQLKHLTLNAYCFSNYRGAGKNGVMVARTVEAVETLTLPPHLQSLGICERQMVENTVPDGHEKAEHNQIELLEMIGAELNIERLQLTPSMCDFNAERRPMYSLLLFQTTRWIASRT